MVGRKAERDDVGTIERPLRRLAGGTLLHRQEVRRPAGDHPGIDVLLKIAGRRQGNAVLEAESADRLVLVIRAGHIGQKPTVGRKGAPALRHRAVRQGREACRLDVEGVEVRRFLDFESAFLVEAEVEGLSVGRDGSPVRQASRRHYRKAKDGETGCAGQATHGDLLAISSAVACYARRTGRHFLRLAATGGRVQGYSHGRGRPAARSVGRRGCLTSRGLTEAGATAMLPDGSLCGKKSR